MSVENLKKYGKLCAEDEKARNKAKEIGLQDLEGHIAYGKTLGLEFTKEDFEALAKEAGLDKKDKMSKEDLSEEELKKVAGGFDPRLGILVDWGTFECFAEGTPAVTPRLVW